MSNFAFLTYISFQSFQRAEGWDLSGPPQSLQLTFINTDSAKVSSSHNSQASRISYSLMF